MSLPLAKIDFIQDADRVLIISGVVIGHSYSRRGYKMLGDIFKMRREYRNI